MPETPMSSQSESGSNWLARIELLKTRFSHALLDVKITERELDFTVLPESLADFAAVLRHEVLPIEHGFCDACGVEREDCLEAVYRLSIVNEPRRVTIRTRVSKQKPVVPTLSHIYKGALWPERELAEMFGVEVVGHPDLRPLLLPENWPGYPLRKDYVYPQEHPYLAPDPLRENPGKILGPDTETEKKGASDKPEADADT